MDWERIYNVKTHCKNCDCLCVAQNGPLNKSELKCRSLLPHWSLKELNLYFNIMNVKLCLLNQEMFNTCAEPKWPAVYARPTTGLGWPLASPGPVASQGLYLFVLSYLYTKKWNEIAFQFNSIAIKVSWTSVQYKIENNQPMYLRAVQPE